MNKKKEQEVMMNYFSLPADFKKETIDRYAVLNSTYKDGMISETYGNITLGNMIESGRQVNVLPAVDLPLLQQYVAYSNSKHISFNYTMNATTLQNREFSQEGVSQIMDFLDKLYQIGVKSLTIALPSLFELVKHTKYDFTLKASTLCQVTNAAKAEAFKKRGARRIVLDESVNRDFRKLKQIRQQVGNTIELIANVVCHKNCIYRMFHYNQMAADSIKISSQASADYYSHRCILQRYENTGNLLRLNWIRPEDLTYYNEIGINHFKIQGRQAVIRGNPVETVRCYLNRHFSGNLMELLDMFDPTNNFKIFIDNKKLDGFIKPFLAEEAFCQSDCSNCHYCDSFAKKCIDHQEAERVIQLANEFYQEYDPFKRILHSGSHRKSDKGKRILTGNRYQEGENFDFR